MRKNYCYAGVTVLIWATLATVAKLVLTDIPNFQALTIGSAFAFVFLLAVNIINGSIRELKTFRLRDHAMTAGLGFLGLFLYSALYYYGIDALGSQEACILNYLWPMMIVIFACIILKEAFTARKIIAMLLSFAGIVVLTMGSGGGASGNRLFGILACVAAAVCYGLFSVLNKRLSLNQNLVMMGIWFTTAVCSLVMSLLFERWQPVSGGAWLGLLWLGVVVNAVAYLLWAIALKGADDSAKIANLAYLVPFLSIVLSAVVLKEQITVNAVTALVLIVGGILLQSVPVKSGGQSGFDVKAYDPETQIAVVRGSICTGERVAGFKDRQSGQFKEVMLIRSQRDLEEFKRQYKVDTVKTEY